VGERGWVVGVVGDGEGGWVDSRNGVRGYRGADAEKGGALLTRPAVYVCPSSDALPQTEVYPPTLVATGDYALCNGALGPGDDDTLVRYENTGAFVYARKRKAAKITAGLSKVYFIGEVLRADLWESTNVWTYGRIHSDSLRSTANPLNTKPGEGVVKNRQNGAFGSDHPGGAFFAFGDGHVAFVADDIDPVLYQEHSSITPDGVDSL